MEGIFGGFNGRFLLHDFVEVFYVNFLLVPDVHLDDREVLIKSLREIEVNCLFHVCAFAQTLGYEVPLHVFADTSYLASFFVEPLDVVSKRFTFSLDNIFEGCYHLWLGPRSCKLSGELVT